MSTGLTPNYSFQYPISTDPVNVAGDMQDLADGLDTFLTNPSFINNIDVDGGSVTTTATTANIFNANATTANIVGAATTITIGATTGTATIRNANTVVTGDLAVNGGDLTTSQTTFNLLNDTATTLNIGGAATTINVGASAGQVNVRGNFNIGNTKVYEINDVTVLSATTLGSSVVSSSLTAVGTLTTGTWNATTIAVGRGGTGLTSYTIGDIVYASASTTLAKLAGVATGNALISGGVGTAPSWGKIGLTTHVSGTLPVANGGTGITSLGSGVATWLGTPSSANLAAAITDETGSGSLVFATSPSLTTPNIGNATASYLTITGAGSGSEGGEMKLNGSPTYSGVIIDNFAGYYRIIQDTPTVMMFSVQSTDINASANRITLNTDVASSPTEDAYFTVERGTSPNVSLRWNETTDSWEFTNDGTNYSGIGSGSGGGVSLESVLMFAGM